VTRRVWAPVGERPIAHGHHRFEWLYVTAFVSPATGECFWYVSNGVSKPFFEALLRLFAEEAGAGRERRIVLTLDNAGWHGEAGLAVPDGVRLVFQPAYTPEVQPAETLWTLVDEPVVNKHIPHPRGARRNHLNAMRRSRQRARKDQEPGRLPLVAENRKPEVITRKPYYLPDNRELSICYAPVMRLLFACYFALVAHEGFFGSGWKVRSFPRPDLGRIG